MGFEYEIHYKSGAENVVADALLRVTQAELLMVAISTIQSNLLDLIKGSWTTNSALQHIIHHKQQNAYSFSNYQT